MCLLMGKEGARVVWAARSACEAAGSVAPHESRRLMSVAQKKG